MTDDELVRYLLAEARRWSRRNRLHPLLSAAADRIKALERELRQYRTASERKEAS